MTKLRGIAIAAVVLAVYVVASATPSAASCAPPVPLTDAVQDSDVVVVGTVTATRSLHRIATVAVEDVWKGDPSDVIEVAGGPDGENSATTVDRTYDVGTRYLFFIYEPGAHGNPSTFGARYEDNICRDTRPYAAELESLRPASAHRVEIVTPPTSPPTAERPTSNDRPWEPLLIATGVATTVVVGALVTRRVRRRRASALGG